LTALEVCKPEYRVAFGDDAEKVRCVSSLSSRTIRPTESFTSLASFSEWKPTGLDDSISVYSPLGFDVEESIHQLLAKLRTTSPTILHGSDSEYLGHLTRLVRESSELGRRIMKHFRSRVLEATRELQDLQDKTQRIRDLLDILAQAASDRLMEQGLDVWPPEVKPRDSAESENTAVASQASRSRSSSIAKPAKIDKYHTSVATQTLPLLAGIARLDGLSPSTSTHDFHLTSLAEIEREIVRHTAASEKEWSLTSNLWSDTKLKQLVKKKKKLEDRIREMEAEKKAEKKDLVSHGTARLKAWIKRIISCDRPAKIEIFKDINEDGCAVGREIKGTKIISGSPCEAVDLDIDGALHTSHVVLGAARRDLLVICQCLDSVSQE
jgi:uncharacterized protein YdcH (DUF465 family)